MSKERRSIAQSVTFCAGLLALGVAAARPSSGEGLATLGEMRVAGAETTYVVNGSLYELIAPRPDLLAEPNGALKDAERNYRQFFSTDPSPIVVLLTDSIPEAASPDSVWIRSDGARIIPIRIAWRGGEVGSRGGGTGSRGDTSRGMAGRFGPGSSFALRAVYRAWLSSHADNRGAPRDHPTAGPDPRIPDWIEDGLVGAIGAGPTQGFLLAQLRDERKTLPALSDLFAWQRPPDAERGETGWDHASGADHSSGGDHSTEDGGGRGHWRHGGRGGDWGHHGGGGGSPPKLEGARQMSAMGVSVVSFLQAKEGAQFVGRMCDRLIDGEEIAAILRDARKVPADVDSLDHAWRDWLGKQKDAEAPEGRGRSRGERPPDDDDPLSPNGSQ